MVALVPIVVFGVLLAVVTVPFVSLGPGPTFDTLGEVDGKQVVAIEGTMTHPTTGHLNMTTVSQRDDLTLGEALTLWLSDTEQLVPRDLIYPPGKSREDVDKANNADFKQSEDSAAYAALGYLKYPSAVTVAKVPEPGPSAGKLKAGDAIDAVNGTPVATVEEFTGLLKNTKPGQTVTIDYRRKNEPAGVAQITLGANKDRDYGFLGVAVLDAPWAPFVVNFNLANVGGPSAGLMFSLAVVDKLTTGDLAGSNFVAGRERSPPTARSARSAASPTRWSPRTRPGPPSSWCRRRTVTRPARQPVRAAPGEGGDARPGGGCAARDHRGRATAELLAAITGFPSA